MNAPLLKVEDVSISIGETRVVDGLDLELHAGQSLGVLGPNGIGKTTFLKVLAGLKAVDKGIVTVQEKPVGDWPRKILARKLGLLLQHTQYAFEASCEDIALIGRHPHLGPLARESDSDRSLARNALSDVGLKGFEQRSCMSLSGGESRRLALATLLVQNPGILMLDEPTNHLDPAHQITVLDLIYKQVKTSNHASIMALHDANLAACYCSHVLLLFGDGEWALGKSDALLNEETLSRLYGCQIRSIKDSQQTVFAINGLNN